MIPISKKLQRWALKALDLGFGCFKDGDHSPFILLIDGTGRRHLIDLKNVNGGVDSKLVDGGREIIRALGSGQLYGLVWDGYLTTNGVKRDAVFVEAAAQGGVVAFVFAQRYRQKKRSGDLVKIGQPEFAANAPHQWDQVAMERAAVEGIRNKTPGQVRSAVNAFSARYAKDWDDWVGAKQSERPELFGRILRKWQATRPVAMRRLRADADHRPPFLEDLLESAAEPLRVLAGLTVLTIAQRTQDQDRAFKTLWKIFSRLPTSGTASCVGITKAVLLLTDGRIGPAFDSEVRRKLGVARPKTCREWLHILESIGEDVAAFESSHGHLTSAVPARFRQLAYGRLYDMALGPR